MNDGFKLHLYTSDAPIYNPQQTQWRRELIGYLVRSESFQKDVCRGNIDTDLLNSWGIVVLIDSQHNMTFELAEDHPR